MGTLEERRAAGAAVMDERKLWPQEPDAAWVRDAVTGLPRDAFCPDRLFVWDGDSAYVPVDRGTDPDGWARAVHPDSPFDGTVTQIGADGLPSSSVSCVTVVADMLDSLVLEKDQRVLELGTGAGWNAGLLALRAGPGRVVSVEIDPGLASAAGARLKAAGLDADVRTGDAASGAPDRAPYDRVIATYAVERVPWAWVAQTRPGGRIVTPWGRLGHVALTVADDGRRAEGWVQGLATFMPARGIGQGLSLDAVRASAPVTRESTVRRDPAPLADGHLLFALRVSHPALRVFADGSTVAVHDGVSSWAVARPGTDGLLRVTGGGPGDVWADVLTGWDHWTAQGSPELWDFGMTVTPTTQTVWLHDPEKGPYAPAAR
ncbi:methyltransferase domain-containing protein [Streptomyces sp. NPDC088557]|uniref:methyltransferase domain-containing protein n=1 Tax=Streptomyces sp. NPDC088557 TaxID=3365867 RepID=UPI0037F165B2